MHRLLRLVACCLLLVAPAQAQRLAFVGDWGAEGSPHRAQVAQAMREGHAARPLDALFTLGDNFYPRGEPIQRFLADFPKVPFYPAYGNHDVPALGKQMELFGTERPYYAVRLGAVEVFVVYSEAFTTAQRNWLEAALQASKAPWKVVALHRPLYSSGMHGGSRSLRQAIEPVLLRHRVRLVLAGHEHDYERLEAKGIAHVISGGGGAWLRAFRAAVPESRVRKVSPNYLVLDATPERLTVTAYDEKNDVLDKTELKQ